MKSAFKKMGNSHAVVIPKPFMVELGASADDPIDISVSKGRIIIEPIRRKVRAGWAEASKKIAAAGDGGLVWPEFPNDGDEDLKW